MLCTGWAWRCVLMETFVCCSTSSFGTDAVCWLGFTLCTNGSLRFCLNISFWHWCCVLFVLDAAYWWRPLFFAQHLLLALMLCIGWAWRCVLMGALDFFWTSSFGTGAVYWLGLTLCTDGDLCFLFNIFFWHWCCVLDGLDAVYWWEPLFFSKHLLLALMLCTG